MPPDRFLGVLLGTAVGDALGLPAEGLRPAGIDKLGWTRDWHHRFLGRRGMWSDDTEHTIMLAQALLAAEGDLDRFQHALARQLRWWLLGLPSGVGFATLRATLRLWLGISPKRAGVSSAGNGPCMRAALVGLCFAEAPEERRQFTEAQATLTHRDPRACTAARAVAELAAHLAGRTEAPSPDALLATLRTLDSADSEWILIVDKLERSWRQGDSLATFLRALGADPARGVSGYAYRTVPAVVHAGLRHRWEFPATVSALLKAGGDTDSTAAIAGALCGALGGPEVIPAPWVAGLAEWPVTVKDLHRLAAALASQEPCRVRSAWSPALLARNLLFLGVVLTHAALRVRLLVPVRN